MNGKALAWLTEQKRYSGNVVVAFKDLTKFRHFWQVQAVVTTPRGERFYSEYLRDYDHISSLEGKPILSSGILDNIAKVLIERAVGDDEDFIAEEHNHLSIGTERFACFEMAENRKSLGEVVYTGREKGARWPH